MNEQPHGPVNDRVRLMTFASMNSWFANRPTEVVGTDGKIKSVTWSKAWHQHPDRRQYDGVEFFPNPDGVPSTPNYLNLWRGFSVTPSSVGTCARFTLEKLALCCIREPLGKASCASFNMLSKCARRAGAIRKTAYWAAGSG